MNQPTDTPTGTGFAPAPGANARAPSPGRILHWNLGHGVWRPLLVIDVDPDNPLQVRGQVFTLLEDQVNVDALPKGTEARKLDRGTRWEIKAVEGAEFGGWRWPPRV